MNTLKEKYLTYKQLEKQQIAALLFRRFDTDEQDLWFKRATRTRSSIERMRFALKNDWV